MTVGDAVQGVIVLSSRPGQIAGEHRVLLPRPRSAFGLHDQSEFWKVHEAVKEQVLGGEGGAGDPASPAKR